MKDTASFGDRMTTEEEVSRTVLKSDVLSRLVLIGLSRKAEALAKKEREREKDERIQGNVLQER